MDPKTTSALDPKLKETYNRVMATPVSPPVSPPPPQPPIQPIAQEPAPTALPTPLTSTSSTATPLPIPQPPTTELHTTIPVGPKPISAAVVAGSGKRKSLSLFPILLVLGSIIFLAVYTIFWLKFFNLKLPFLPF